MNSRKAKFTLIELLVVISIIGILTSILLPTLSKARLKGQMAVCKSNLKQIYFAEMQYSTENNQYVYTTGAAGAEWMTAKSWRISNAAADPNFHDGNTPFLEPYLGPKESNVYKCPAAVYDQSENNYLGTLENGRSYTGFMHRNNSKPEKWEKVYLSIGNDRYFDDLSRRPFIFDMVGEMASTGNFGFGNSLVHGNTEKLNLLITDGSVVPFNLPVSLWSRGPQLTWLSYIESAIGQ
jgi:prepilin-type N-terminal cleavage/methylation domain-containing protein